MTVTERAPLTRDAIARAAIAIIDEHGLEAVTMRRIGEALGVEAMSLYNHVANKDDLLDTVVELLYDEINAAYEPDPDADWKEKARALAGTYRRVILRHERAFPLVSDRPTQAESNTRFMLRCYELFTSAGLDDRRAALAFNVAASFVIGTIRHELGLMRLLEAGEGITEDSVPPELARAVDFKEACLSWTADERFEYGMEACLAGLEETIAAVR